MNLPIYTTIDSVKVRLGNKIQFQADPSVVEDGEVSNQLLNQLIRDAETDIEMQLRSRYAIPFRSKRTGAFRDLPDHTQRALRKAVDRRAVIEIIHYDFGRGTHIDAEAYDAELKDFYKAEITLLLGRDQMGDSGKIDRFKFSPPLEDLMLSANNQHGDDGFRGTICNSDASVNDPASFAKNAINDPSKAYPRTRGPGGL